MLVYFQQELCYANSSSCIIQIVLFSFSLCHDLTAQELQLPQLVDRCLEGVDAYTLFKKAFAGLVFGKNVYLRSRKKVYAAQ